MDISAGPPLRRPIFRKFGPQSRPSAANARSSRVHGAALLPYGILFVFCAAGLYLRPLLPPDETRYLSVAWEMYVGHNFFLPTLNFLPYHHKPPLLFWMIDAVWMVTGPSRTAAVFVIFAISSATMMLTQRLAKSLFPASPAIVERVPWLVLGNFIFVFYASLILFDLLLTAIVMAAFLVLRRFSRTGRRRDAAIAGLLLGLGVLAKGPVVFIHMGWPIVLYPLWREEGRDIASLRFYRGLLPMLGAALAAVAIWVVPAIAEGGRDFAYNLLWEQSAGRISGRMEASHPRPVYFYFMILPALLLPWCLSPALWLARPLQRLRRLAVEQSLDHRRLRFLALWAVGIVATFSAISGKQPHYIMPVMPLASIAFALFMDTLSMRSIKITAVLVVAACVGAQAISERTFRRYDLAETAAFAARHADAPLAVVGRYEGEITFLARLTKSLESVPAAEAAAWLAAHPGGHILDTTGALADKGLASPVHQQAYRSRKVAIYGAE